MLKRRLKIYFSLIIFELVIFLLFIILNRSLANNNEPIIYQVIVKYASSGLIILVNIIAGLTIGVGSKLFRFILGFSCGLILEISRRILGIILSNPRHESSTILIIAFSIVLILPIILFELTTRLKLKKLPADKEKQIESKILSHD